jgi:hypothetical protein
MFLGLHFDGCAGMIFVAKVRDFSAAFICVVIWGYVGEHDYIASSELQPLEIPRMQLTAPDSIYQHPDSVTFEYFVSCQVRCR